MRCGVHVFVLKMLIAFGEGVSRATCKCLDIAMGSEFMDIVIDVIDVLREGTFPPNTYAHMKHRDR